MSKDADHQNRISLKETADGSHTLVHGGLEETYHSSHGALTESQHVFIKNGWEYWLEVNPNATALYLLEVGFGTGLNAFLTVLASKKHPEIFVYYETIEPYPLPAEVVSQLNYPQFFSVEEQDSFLKVHQAAWEEQVPLQANFQLNKLEVSIEAHNSSQKYHLIYFDAFAPNKQPDMWADTIIQKMYDYTAKGGVLVTYCAKGSFKRSLKAAGFQVENLPGPPGKREITRAIKV